MLHLVGRVGGGGEGGRDDAAGVAAGDGGGSGVGGKVVVGIVSAEHALELDEVSVGAIGVVDELDVGSYLHHSTYAHYCNLICVLHHGCSL